MIGLVFVPLYIKFLGIEAYGLIGIYISLVGILLILDMGLSTTLTRIMAQHQATGYKDSDLRNLVRSFETIYWLLGILLGLLVFFTAPLLVDHWINTQGMTKATVLSSVRLMGGLILLQWPTTVYSSALMGLEKQVLLNLVRSVSAIAQATGAVLILWLVSPTIQAFFIWQLSVSLLQVLVLYHCLWKILPLGTHSPLFEKKWLLLNWQFSAGTMGIAMLGTILTQLDKVILSKWCSLKLFGYYMLAVSVSTALGSLASPVFSAVFPRFSQLYAKQDEQALAAVYHNSSQLLSMIVVPAGITIVFFAEPILLLWVRNAETAHAVAPLLRLLMIGSIANSLVMLPFGLQLASGWTKLSIYKNIIAVVFIVPLLVVLIKKYGAIGGAVSWLAVNCAYLIFEIPVMHRRLLRAEMALWYIYSVVLPVFTASAVCLVLKASFGYFNLDVYSVFVSPVVSGVLLLFLLPLGGDIRLQLLKRYRRFAGNA